MLDLHLTRGEHNDWVTLRLPTSPAEIGEVYAWLDCISTCVDDTRIAAVSSSVPNIRQYIRNSDLNDIKKLNRLAGQIDSMDQSTAQTFAGALDAESINELDDVVRIAEHIRTVEDIHAELPQRLNIGQYWSRTSLPDYFPKICSKNNMLPPDSIQALAEDWDVVHAYVYENGGRTEFLFRNTPENIASFIGSRPAVDQMILTDRMDELIMDTIGNFIDHCPDKVLLEEVKNILIPIQLGEVEPGSLFCPSMEEINAFYQQQEYLDMGMQMH